MELATSIDAIHRRLAVVPLSTRTTTPRAAAVESAGGVPVPGVPTRSAPIALRRALFPFPILVVRPLVPSTFGLKTMMTPRPLLALVVLAPLVGMSTRLLLRRVPEAAGAGDCPCEQQQTTPAADQSESVGGVR